MFFSGSNYFYYITIGLQIFCAIHCVRRGTLNKWIWLIVFLPLVGSLVYIYSEILTNRSSFTRPINTKPTINVSAVLNPGGRIKKLEEQLRFTDTFANRVNLADAYMASGYTDKAVELYESSLKGAFAENEDVLLKLIPGYFEQERYEEFISIAKKLYKLPQFPRSKAHLLYAMALERIGNSEQAENEFKSMKGRYSYFEQRYEYGMFLIRAGRESDASNIFTDILTEEPHLSQMERKAGRVWFSKTKDELNKIQAASKMA